MRIYLDHNATTPLHEEVVELMARVLRDVYGNPSSTHAEGAAAKHVLEEARVADLVGPGPRDVVFTGSATEGNNAVIQAAVDAAGDGAHVVTTTAEHPSVEGA